jgi:hypothetical protein
MDAYTKISFTVFLSTKSQIGHSYTQSWKELASYIAKHKVYEQKELAPLIQLSTAKIVEKRALAGGGSITRSQRGFEALEAVTAIGLDIDQGMTIDSARDVLKSLGLAYVLYTTFSHTSEKQKFRIVLPLSRPIGKNEADLYDAIWLTLNKHFDGKLDASCCDMARLFYIASKSPQSTSAFSEVNLSGNWIEVEKFESVAKEIMLEREAARQRRADIRRTFGEAGPSDIQLFNNSVDICEILDFYGYVRCSDDRYLSPQSQSGSPGVTIADNVCFIRHDNDVLMNRVAAHADALGWEMPRQGTRFGFTPVAPFDFILHLECNGSFTDAIRLIKTKVTQWNL